MPRKPKIDIHEVSSSKEDQCHDETLCSIREMFLGQIDPDVVHMVLVESQWKVDQALEVLFGMVDTDSKANRKSPLKSNPFALLYETENPFPQNLDSLVPPFNEAVSQLYADDSTKQGGSGNDLDAYLDTLSCEAKTMPTKNVEGHGTKPINISRGLNHSSKPTANIAMKQTLSDNRSAAVTNNKPQGLPNYATTSINSYPKPETSFITPITSIQPRLYPYTQSVIRPSFNDQLRAVQKPIDKRLWKNTNGQSLDSTGASWSVPTTYNKTGSSLNWNSRIPDPPETCNKAPVKLKDLSKPLSVIDGKDKKIKDTIADYLKAKKKVLIVMRGLPGSGKSTLARGLQFSGVVFSTDDYFMDDGEYRFDISKLPDGHEWNKQRAYQAMQRGASPVIIDNTNTQLWEFKPYISKALEHDYCIEIVEPNTSWKFNARELSHRTSHGVPIEKIRKMLGRYDRNLNVNSVISSIRQQQNIGSPSPHRPNKPPHHNHQSPQHSNKKQQNTGSPKKHNKISPAGPVHTASPSKGVTARNELQNKVESPLEKSSNTNYIDKNNLKTVSSSHAEPEYTVGQISPARLQGPTHTQSLGSPNTYLVQHTASLQTRPGLQIPEALKITPLPLPSSKTDEGLNTGPLPEDQQQHTSTHNTLESIPGVTSEIYKPVSANVNTYSFPSNIQVTGDPLESRTDACHTEPKDCSNDADREIVPEPSESSESDDDNTGTINCEVDNLDLDEKRERLDVTERVENVPTNTPNEVDAINSLNTQSSKDSESKSSLMNVFDNDISKEFTQNLNALNNELGISCPILLEGDRPIESEEGTITKMVDGVDCSNVKDAQGYKMNEKVVLSEHSEHSDNYIGAIGSTTSPTSCTKVSKDGKTLDCNRDKDVQSLEHACRAKAICDVNLDDEFEEFVKHELQGDNALSAIGANYEACDDVETSNETCVPVKENKPRKSRLAANLSPILPGSLRDHCMKNDWVIPEYPSVAGPDIDEGIVQETSVSVSTQTETCDFTHIYSIGNESEPFVSESTYRILTAQPRYINRGNYSMPLSSPARRLKLDKGIMTDSTISESESDLEFLKSCFPAVPTDDLHDLLEKCMGNVEWASNILLDSGVEVYDSSDLSDAKLHDISLSPVTSYPLTSLTSYPVTSQTSDAKLLDISLSPVTSHPLTSYPVTPYTSHLDASCLGKLHFDSKETASKITSSNSVMSRPSSDNIVPSIVSSHVATGPTTDDGLMTFSLDPSFAIILEQLFGPVCTNSEDVYSGRCTYDSNNLKVKLGYNMAKKIHRSWRLTYDGHHGDSRHGDEEETPEVVKILRTPITPVLDILKQDEQLARRLQEDEEIRLSNSPSGYRNVTSYGGPTTTSYATPTSLHEIMQEEMATAVTRNEYEEAQSKTSATLASKIKKQNLYKMFPLIDKTVIDQTFINNECDEEKTTTCLRLLTSNTPVSSSVYASGTAVKCTPPRPVIKDCVDEASAFDSQEVNYEEYQTLEDPDYDDFRTEALMHHKQRHACFQKSQEAYRRGMKDVASFYSQQGHMHTEKMKEANIRAAERILYHRNQDIEATDTVDLHGLHVAEALEVLKQSMLERNTGHSSRKPASLSVITGRGKGSKGGIAKIKPAVIDFLKRNNYVYSDEHPGLVKVRFN